MRPFHRAMQRRSMAVTPYSARSLRRPRVSTTDASHGACISDQASTIRRADCGYEGSRRGGPGRSFLQSLARCSLEFTDSVMYHRRGHNCCKRVPLNTRGSAGHDVTYGGQDAKPLTTVMPHTVVERAARLPACHGADGRICQEI